MKDALRVKVMLQIAMFTAAAFVPVAWSAEDPAVSETPAFYSPDAKSLLAPLAPVAGGDVAEVDVQHGGGTLTQYIGLALNADGDTVNAAHPFLKVQGSSSGFTNGACYLGNGGAVAGSFGLGFFPLTEAFTSAHMKAERIGDTVTVSFTNVDGGTKADQVYVCTGAPPRLGDTIGIGGWNDATADNFSVGDAVLDDFSYVGSLGSSGLWFDAAPGMTADGSVAKGGPQALSFFVKHESIHSDFDGDGKADILWRNTGSGQVVIWLMDGTTKRASKGIGGAPSNWEIEKIQDYNGDGKADILWRNTDNGKAAVWLMNGFTKLESSVIGTVSKAWQIQP